MIDRLFAATLTFCMLAAGTAAIGSEWIASKAPLQASAIASPRVVQLPMVVVTGRRLAAASTDVAQAGSDVTATIVE